MGADGRGLEMTGSAGALTPGYYPFNDMHAIMAYVGAGDLARAGAAQDWTVAVLPSSSVTR